MNKIKPLNQSPSLSAEALNHTIKLQNNIESKSIMERLKDFASII